MEIASQYSDLLAVISDSLKGILGMRKTSQIAASAPTPTNEDWPQPGGSWGQRGKDTSGSPMMQKLQTLHGDRETVF
jgi:hypothetical protein